MAIGKKADVKFIAFIVLAIVGGLIFVVFVIMPTTTTISSDSGDVFCHLNAALKSAVVVGGKWPIPLLLCHERTAKVDANNWNECDADGKRGWKAANNREPCATYQLAKLGKRCFEMYGEDTYNFGLVEIGTTPCFKAKVVDLLPAGAVIDEQEFTEGMRANGYCTNANRFNNDNKGCGNSENVAGWRDVKSGENKICFDEFAGSADGLRVNDGC